MSDKIPVHCRYCNEVLDVWEPHETRFCSQDCADNYAEEADDRLRQMAEHDLQNALRIGQVFDDVFKTMFGERK